MIRHQRSTEVAQRRPSSHCCGSREGGAVIIVVVSLMTTLLFLGLFFYNWTSQERATAEFYGNSDPMELDPDSVFDQAAEQLIVGTKTGYEESALWGGMHSMLAHQIGRINSDLTPTDTNPRTGHGIIIRYVDNMPSGSPDGYPDLTNGKPDADTTKFQFLYTDLNGNSQTQTIDDFVINYSHLAQDDRSKDAFNQSPPIPVYRPDVDYTYPDHNTLFLAHEDLSPANPTNLGLGNRRVLIPSFFRPQLFPDYRSTDGTKSFLNLYTDATRKKQVFRPHKEHKYSNGDVRFLQSSTTAGSGDRSRVLAAFPFPSSAANAQMGIFTKVTTEADSANYSLLDVDLDGDGIKDAIWMDLDLPMLDLADGRQVVPLASFKVLDADGLLNLNAHGNIQGAARLSRTYTGSEPFSVSNNGMSRSEVNPIWALSGDLSALTTAEQQAALRNTADKFGFDPTTFTPGRLSLGNMEFLMMMTGWNPTTGEAEAVGRYGERDRLIANQTPYAGQSQTDDDGDNATNGGFGQQKTNDADVYSKLVPGFVHPTSPIGMGLRGYSATTGGYLNTNGTYGAVRNLGQPLTNNPATWPQYDNFQTLAVTDYPPALLTNPVTNSLSDEDDETILEPGSALYGQYDTPFESSDSAFLQLSDSDLYQSGISSRLSYLASANFQHVKNAAQIRKQFTTDSWDRLDFNFSAPTFRQWEWGYGTTDQFPPQFNVSGSNVQPFRQEIRDLMRTDFQKINPYGANRDSPRQRLNLNRILSNDQLAGGSQGAFVDGSPRYRNLVPHPNAFSGADTASIMANAMYHGNGAPPVMFSLVNTNAYAQEWWARYDRQRLARDIYCLLWVLGCGNDGVNLTTAMSNPYTTAQTREMAQFAVNVVDAMDRDSNISAFEYDENLTDGWDTTSSNLSVVYGIEHQELAFNEVLFIKTNSESAPDKAITEYDDTDTTNGGGYYFSFVELRNAAPWAVPIDDGTWRIRRLKPSDGTQLFKATLRRKSTPLQSVPTNIAAGGEFLIGCQSGDDRYTTGSGNSRTSDFRVDYDNNGTFDCIVPNIIETTVPTTGTSESTRHPLCDLDLIHSDHVGCIEETTSPTNSMVNRGNGLGEVRVRLVLERRMRPDNQAGGADALSDTANPWVEVDRVEGDIRTFVAGSLASLDTLKSQERRSPYDSGNDITYSVLTPLDYSGSATSTDGLHTMPYLTKAAAGAGVRRNNIATNPFTLWQPHFDRDFTSVMELLSIPIYGPYPVSAGAGTWAGAVFGGVTRNLSEPGKQILSGHRTAAIRMLNPQADGDTNVPMPSWYPTGLTGDAVHYQNRWYRLLEYVDVKSQDVLRMDPIQAVQRRTPGKVNLNTIRHEAVFAGLVDDPYHIDPRNFTTMTQDLLEGTNRLWYYEHRRSRDGVDYFMNAAGYPNLTIPGSFNARPFRSNGYLDSTDISGTTSANRSIQHTLLRQRDTTTGHGLYEARRDDDNALNFIDYHTRQRILAKIANNSTTRSNLFFVWIGLDFFEAHQNSNNNVQIGAKADDLPSYRMFCVVDMSRLEEAYYDADTSDSNPGTFDFRKFIIHRQLLP